MNTLYPNSIREYVRTRDWPKGLVFDVVEYESWLGFRFYADNFATLKGEELVSVAATIKEVMEKIRGLGIPCYLEKQERAPRGRSGLA